MTSSTTIGTCSICGGRVSVPTIWHGIIPPVPQCESCGATQRSPHGPIIDMVSVRQTKYGNKT